MNGRLRRLARGDVDAISTSEVLVVGSGVAGLAAALGASPRRTSLLTKTRLGEGGSSAWAQGGVAVALGKDDTPALHVADTLAVAAGLGHREVVEVLAQEGPARVRELVALGARFDRDTAGTLALGREAGHRRRRIVHARGDATGAEMVRALTDAVRRAPGVEVHEASFAVDLVLDPDLDATRGGRVAGVLAVDEGGRRVLHLASAVVLATGGVGRLFLRTTNPPEVTGDGLAMAARAGARLVDLELVQFHPTALATGADPMPLVTEALRGEGAVLVDGAGRRFMPAEHPDAELAPRDVVARAIWRRTAGREQVFLDTRRAVGERFPERFPTVFAACREWGVDPRVDPIPVSPAAHYHMGGVATDDRGRTSLPGLWACGEAASTGVHGANRLASNSLLEGLVFGARVAVDAARGPAPVPSPDGARWWAASPSWPATRKTAEAAAEAALRRLLWESAGLVRDGAGLARAAGELAAIEPASLRLRNLATGGRLIVAAARAREESRGGHFSHRLSRERPRVAAPPVRDPRRPRRAGRLSGTAARPGRGGGGGDRGGAGAVDGGGPRGGGTVSGGVPGARLVPLYPLLYEDLVRRALAEDLGRAGDVTTDAVVPVDLAARARLVARRGGRVAGLDVALAAFSSSTATAGRRSSSATARTRRRGRPSR